MLLLLGVVGYPVAFFVYLQHDSRTYTSQESLRSVAQAFGTEQDCVMRLLSAASVPVVASVSMHERNWGGCHNLARLHEESAAAILWFSQPHGWEGRDVVASALAVLRMPAARRRRRLAEV